MASEVRRRTAGTPWRARSFLFSVILSSLREQLFPALGRRIDMIKHEINYHTGHRDIEP